MRWTQRSILTVIVGLFAADLHEARAEPATANASRAPYERVQAIFDQRCTWCHGGDRPTQGLRLEDHASVLAGGNSGRVVVPGDPDASELIRRVRGDATPRMPLDGPPYLDEADIALLVAWVAEGALATEATPAEATAPPATTATIEATATTEATELPSPPVVEEETGPVTFRRVKPLLLRNCVHCHTSDGVQGPAPEGLVLARWSSVLAGGERQVVVPGQPILSLLYRHAAGLESPRMPLDGPPYLDQAALDLLRRWIEDGARDEHGAIAPRAAGGFVKLRGQLTARWALDGAPFDLAPGARVRDVVLGGAVEVRGTVQADGRLQATRVRGR